MKRNIVLITVFAVFLTAFSAPGRADERELQTYNVNYGEAAELAKVIEGLKSPGGEVTVYEARNVIIVHDYPEAQARISALLSKLDAPSEQVLINVLSVQMSETAMRKAGIVGQGEVLSPVRFGEIGYLIGNDSFSNKRSEMTLRTISGKPAKLQVANQEFYPGEVYRDDGYTVVRPSRERKAGSLLDVTPRVNGDGTIRVDITPTQSEFTGDYTSREYTISTSVIINDGDTIVLGGVGASSQITVRNNVPATDLGVGRAETQSGNNVTFLTVNVDR